MRLDSSDSKYVLTAPLLLGREDSVILNGAVLGSLFSSMQNKEKISLSEVGWERIQRDPQNGISRGRPWGIIVSEFISRAVGLTL